MTKRISTGVICVLGLMLALTEAKPIMVTFGTSQGPIAPRASASSTHKAVHIAPKTVLAKNPAPVSEETEDVPNPVEYRPLVPHQYRTKLYSVKPPSNLILGTPIDQKYTPSINKYDIYKKQERTAAVGVEYTGPNVFERQEYEYIEAKKQKTTLQPSQRYPHHHNNHHQHHQNYQNSRYVPQIGIIYSSGVRYYVPQIFYNNNQNQKPEEQENSVYDQNDQKHFYRVNQ